MKPMFGKQEELPRFAQPLYFLLLVTVLLFAFILQLAMKTIDQQQTDALHQLIMNNIHDKQERLANGLAGYAYWDDAVENFIIKYDPGWAKKTIDEPVPTEQGIQYIYVFGPDNKPIHNFQHNNGESPSESISDDEALTGYLEKVLPRVRTFASLSPTKPVVGTLFLPEQKKIFLVSGALIRAHYKTFPAEQQSGLMFFVREIGTANEYKQIAQDFGVQSVYGAIAPSPKDISIPLNDFFGQPHAMLVVQAKLPSTAFMAIAIRPLIIALGFFIVLSFLILRKATKVTERIIIQKNRNLALAAGLEANSQGIVLLVPGSDNWQIDYVNQAMLEMTGFTSDVLLNQPWPGPLLPSSVPSTLRIDVTRLEKGHSWENESRISQANGKTIWVSLRYDPILDQGGSQQGYVVTLDDITEKKLEAHIALKRDRLLAMGELSGSAAQELNQILSPIIKYIELLQNTNIDPEVKNNLVMLIESCRQAGHILKGMLAFANQHEAPLSRQSLSIACQNVISRLRLTLPSHIQITTDGMARDDLEVVINQQQLHQLFENMVDNASWAIFHSASGSGQIHITLQLLSAQQLANPDLEHAALVPQRMILPAGSYAILSISDDGVGIERENFKKIFEPFFTTRPKGEGSGLGLAVVQGIVQSWHGFIEVDSLLGLGTTFRIYIPVAC